MSSLALPVCVDPWLLPCSLSTLGLVNCRDVTEPCSQLGQTRLSSQLVVPHSTQRSWLSPLPCAFRGQQQPPALPLQPAERSAQAQIPARTFPPSVPLRVWVGCTDNWRLRNTFSNNLCWKLPLVLPSCSMCPFKSLGFKAVC